MLAAFHAGALTFCECKAGQAKQRWLASISGRYESDDQQIQRYRQDAVARNANRLFTDAGVPPKFLQYTWESFKKVAGQDKGKELLITAIEAYFAAECIQREDGQCWGIFAWGNSDMGKTGALSQLFLHYLHNGRSGLWVQYNTLMRELRKFEDGNVDQRIDECKKVEYLFIDDFGDPLTSGEVSNYSRDVMMQIIDHRNSYGKAMFITSNLNLETLAGQFHQRLAKRMMESCFVVEVKGKPLGVLGGRK
jgi:DNA replication protein DnaC